MENAAFQLFVEWVWVPVSGGLVWMSKRLIEHGEKIAILQATTASTEVVRSIIGDATKPLKLDIDRSIDQQKERDQRIERQLAEIRKAVGSRYGDG